jgi:hypothetical protein
VYLAILILQEQVEFNCEDFQLHSPIVLKQALVGGAMITATWLIGVRLRRYERTLVRLVGVVVMGFSLLLYFAIVTSAFKFGVTPGRSSSWPTFPCYPAPYSDLDVCIALILLGVAMVLSAKRWRPRATG